MKDFYHFLGIAKDASEEEIRKAYRKLSTKYHPDKNENDPFFQKRFIELSEAYETLIDAKARKIYDQNLLHNPTSYSLQDPIIKEFSASKIRIKKGSEVRIYWQTFHADVVKIQPFGLEKASGERIIKINEFDAQGNFYLLLNAQNSHTSKMAAARLCISELNKDDNLSSSTEIPPYEVPSNQKTQKKVLPKAKLYAITVLMIIIILLLFLIKG